MARARDILLRLTGDPTDAKRALGDVTSELKSFDRIQAEARADIETAGAKAKLERLENQLTRLSKQEATPAVQIKAASTVRAIEKIEADLKRLDGKKVDVTINETVNRAGGGGSSAGAGAAGGAAARLAGPAVAGAAIAGLGGKLAIDTATSINESLSKNVVLFGDAAKAVERFADTSAEKLGISKAAALEATGTFGNLLVALGIGPKKAADMSTELVKLSADLASFNNASPEEALDAIRSGLTGETEPLKRFGVNINDAALKSEGLALGLTKVVVDQDKVRIAQIRATLAQDKYNETVKKFGKNSDEAKTAQAGLLSAQGRLNKERSGKAGDLDAQSKALAAQSLIFKQTEKAQGDFANTSKGLANSTRIAKAEVSDLSAELGGALQPAANSVVNAFIDLLRGARENFPAVKKVIKGVIDDVRGFLRRNREDVRNVIEGIKGIVRGLVRSIRGVVKTISGILTGDFGKAWDGVKDIFGGGIDQIKGVLRLALVPIKAAGKAIGNAVKNGIKGALNGLKGIGEGAINILIDVVNAGLKEVNKVLRPRDLGPLGTTPDLRVGLIGRLGGDDKPKPGSGSQRRPGAPNRSPGGFTLPPSARSAIALPAPSLAAGFSGRGGVTIENVNLPPAPAAAVPDARFQAAQFARLLEQAGR